MVATLAELTDALIELALAAGMDARLVDYATGYEVLEVEGVELIVERTPKGYTLAAYVPHSLDTQQLASGKPRKLLETALDALRGFQGKLAA